MASAAPLLRMATAPCARPALHEKNWMPRVAGDTLKFVSLCDPTRIVDDEDRTVTETAPPIQPTSSAAARSRSPSTVAGSRWSTSASARQTAVLSAPFVWFDGGTALRQPGVLPQKRG